VANRLANRLIALDCSKGSRAAVLAKNALWYPVLHFAAAKASAACPGQLAARASGVAADPHRRAAVAAGCRGGVR